MDDPIETETLDFSHASYGEVPLEEEPDALLRRIREQREWLADLEQSMTTRNW